MYMQQGAELGSVGGGYNVPANAQVIQVVHPAAQAPVPVQQYPAIPQYPAAAQGPAQSQSRQIDPMSYYKQYASGDGLRQGKVRAVVKATDIMDEDMVQDCIDVAAESLRRFTKEKDMARFIKFEMDKKFDPTWHVIVGKSFGSYIAHERGTFCHFYIGPLAVMLFKLR